MRDFNSIFQGKLSLPEAIISRGSAEWRGGRRGLGEAAPGAHPAEAQAGEHQGECILNDSRSSLNSPVVNQLTALLSVLPFKFVRTATLDNIQERELWSCFYSTKIQKLCLSANKVFSPTLLPQWPAGTAMRLSLLQQWPEYLSRKDLRSIMPGSGPLIINSVEWQLGAAKWTCDFFQSSPNCIRFSVLCRAWRKCYTINNTMCTLLNFPPGQGWRSQCCAGDLPPRVQPRLPCVRRRRP